MTIKQRKRVHLKIHLFGICTESYIQLEKKRKEKETKTEKFENWSNIKTHTNELIICF